MRGIHRPSGVKWGRVSMGERKWRSDERFESLAVGHTRRVRLLFLACETEDNGSRWLCGEQRDRVDALNHRRQRRQESRR